MPSSVLKGIERLMTTSSGSYADFNRSVDTTLEHYNQRIDSLGDKTFMPVEKYLGIRLPSSSREFFATALVGQLLLLCAPIFYHVGPCLRILHVTLCVFCLYSLRDLAGESIIDLGSEMKSQDVIETMIDDHVTSSNTLMDFLSALAALQLLALSYFGGFPGFYISLNISLLTSAGVIAAKHQQVSVTIKSVQQMAVNSFAEHKNILAVQHKKVAELKSTIEAVRRLQHADLELARQVDKKYRQDISVRDAEITWQRRAMNGFNQRKYEQYQQACKDKQHLIDAGIATRAYYEQHIFDLYVTNKQLQRSNLNSNQQIKDLKFTVSSLSKENEQLHNQDLDSFREIKSLKFAINALNREGENLRIMEKNAKSNAENAAKAYEQRIDAINSSSQSKISKAWKNIGILHDRLAAREDDLRKQYIRLTNKYDEDVGHLKTQEQTMMALLVKQAQTTTDMEARIETYEKQLMLWQDESDSEDESDSNDDSDSEAGSDARDDSNPSKEADSGYDAEAEEETKEDDARRQRSDSLVLEGEVDNMEERDLMEESGDSDWDVVGEEEWPEYWDGF